MINQTSLATGQHEARTRWGTHESGAAFDNKKSTYLTQQAQEFIAQQSFGVIAGAGTDYELAGILAMGTPGFVQVLDEQTCLIKLESKNTPRSFLQTMQQRPGMKLGLFFIRHTTRERLCVQGEAELLINEKIEPSYEQDGSVWICLYVHQAFFHCVKYIRTRINGLTFPSSVSDSQQWRQQDIAEYKRAYLSEEIRAFIAEQILCFLCSITGDGQRAVNHRGGAAGFLVTDAPRYEAPGGMIYLPDYTGNGAFEAVGNIFETGQAALVIPNYAAHLALCVSGSAAVLELEEVPEAMQRACVGAERVVAISVQHVEMQSGDWSHTLKYVQSAANATKASEDDLAYCKL